MTTPLAIGPTTDDLVVPARRVPAAEDTVPALARGLGGPERGSRLRPAGRQLATQLAQPRELFARTADRRTRELIRSRVSTTEVAACDRLDRWDTARVGVEERAAGARGRGVLAEMLEPDPVTRAAVIHELSRVRPAEHLRLLQDDRRRCRTVDQPGADAGRDVLDRTRGAGADLPRRQAATRRDETPGVDHTSQAVPDSNAREDSRGRERRYG